MSNIKNQTKNQGNQSQTPISSVEGTRAYRGYAEASYWLKTEQELDTPQSGIVKTQELALLPTRARIIHSDFSQHTLHVSRINADECPSFIYISNKDAYTEFYVVRNQDAGGMIFMYLGKGNKNAPKEIVAWYPRGAFWRSYGTTIKAAIEGAQRDGWLYA